MTINVVGEGTYQLSGPTGGTIFTAQIKPEEDSTAPTFSQEITTSSITSNSTTLSWQAIDASGINYYRLKCGVGSDADNLSSTVFLSDVGLNTSQTLTNLQPNTTYACEVNAWDLGSGGNGNANGSKTSWTTPSG